MAARETALSDWAATVDQDSRHLELQLGVFADPGERDSNGVPDPAKFRLRILHENDF